MPTVHTEAEINAPIESVWDALLDFSSYAKWNPGITNVQFEGALEPGALGTLSVILKTGAKPSDIAIRLAEIKAQRALCWVGAKGPRWLVGARHYHYLEPLPDGGTKLIHGEHFNGLVFRLIWPFMGASFVKLYDESTAAIKHYCETQTV